MRCVERCPCSAPRSNDRWLRVDRSAVDLELATTRVDLNEVERAAASSEQAVLQAAADHARGPFLAGFALRDSAEFDDWRATRAVAVERSVAAVLDQLASVAEANGDVVAARGAAERRVDLDPLDEGAHRRLMALLARSGDRAAAIRQYRVCVGVLERELGVAPLAETAELYEAIRDTRAVSAAERLVGANGTSGAVAAPIPVRSRLPLVGRGTALAAIVAAYRASAVDGRVTLVTGEAGIGKSRLLEAAVDAVGEDGGRALVARSYASEAGIAYGPIVELLRAGAAQPDAAKRLSALPPRTRTELERLISLPPSGAGRQASSREPALTGDPAARTRLLEAIADGLSALVAGTRPGLVAVEDMQWADDATRAMLAWLARRLAGRPILLVLTWRPEDLDELGAAFASTVEALPTVEQLRLERLDRDAVLDLVAAAAAGGLRTVGADQLLAESEGLPLFLNEALQGADAAHEGSAGGRADVDGDHPGRTVRALIRERLASVTETGSQVLSAAAVIGRSFDAGLVRGSSGRSEDEIVDALEELVRRGLVRETGAGADVTFDFAHAKFRDAVYEGTSLARRRLLHGRTADLLRTTGSRDEPGRLAQIAIHERDAGREAAAAEAFREAGIRSRELYALHEAGAHLETALALGHPDVAGIQIALGEVRTAEGDYAGAIAALEAAAAVSDDRGLPGIELRLGRVHARRGDPSTAASHLDAAIEALDAADTNDRARGREATPVHALVERALVAISVGDLDLAGAMATRALAVAQAGNDAAAEGAADRMLGLIARERGDLETARSSLRRSLDLAQGDPDPGAAIAAGNALALVEASAGDRDTAIELLEVALDVARRTGELHLEAAVENNLADQLHAAGRPDEAMVHLKRAVTLFADVGGRPGELEPEIWKLVTW